MITTTLTEAIPTPLGTYGPGTRVYPLRAEADGIRVCVDPTGRHLGRRCHTVKVPRAALSVTQHCLSGWDVGAA